MTATNRPLRAEDITLQLCEPRPVAFTQAGWAFELKLDGFRLLAERVGGTVRLVLRRGREATQLFPEITSALQAMPGPDFILDGEVVIQDANGKPIFERLLKRSTLVSPRDIAQRALAEPAAFFAFDLVMLDGQDLRPQPLRDRKAMLFQLVPKGLERVLPVDHVEGQGEALLLAVKARGLEGIVAKRLDAPYRGGRSDAWQKIALAHLADFAVCGYADDWGALYLATWDGERFVYAGKVGSGFTPKRAQAVKSELEAHRVERPAIAGDLPNDKDAVWVTPTLVIEVRYKTWTEGLAPRQPVFVRFREDKAVQDCPTPKLPGARQQVSNPDKVYFPEDGITKRELVSYYVGISPWLLPYLRDRPLVLTRYPDGIGGKSFFQKKKPLRAPGFVQGKNLEQLLCDDLQSLEWLANLGVIPIHLPAWRLAARGRPDWITLDFDPKGAPFEDVIALASALHRLCEEAGLPCYPKTSGASGLHVLVPLGGQLDWPGARQLAELLATLLARRHPAIATVERTISKREGRVYLDVGQNGEGKVVAAPFTVRPLPKAPVSMPLWWEEVKPGLTPRSFTIREAIARMQERGDPMARVLTEKPPLAEILERLLTLRQ